MDKLNLEQFDVDGAVAETGAEAALGGDTRLGFLRKAGMAGGAPPAAAPCWARWRRARRRTDAGIMATTTATTVSGAPPGVRARRHRHPELRPGLGVSRGGVL